MFNLKKKKESILLYIVVNIHERTVSHFEISIVIYLAAVVKYMGQRETCLTSTVTKA